MATAKITLIGLYNYDETIFNGLQLPEYFERQTVIDTILLNCGEFECMYPDPVALAGFIRIWSRKNQRFFEHLAAVMQEEYLPLANYDRHEEWNDITTGHTDSKSNIKDNGTSTGKVSAYNEDGFQNRDQQTTTSTNDATGSTDANGSGEHTGHLYGNIGVTTTQQIFREEVSVAAMSPYNIIADVFSNEFCVKIYV